jgi:chromate transport protein ChrA
MILLAHFYGAARHLPGFTSAIDGLVAAAVGLMLATTARLGRANIKGWWTLAVALAAFAAVVGLRADAALVVIIAGVLGLTALVPVPGRRPRKAGGR